MDDVSPLLPEALSRRRFLRVAAGAAGVTAALAEVGSAAELMPPVWQPTSDRKLRMGVVGGGFGLSFHWHEHPNCVVEAVSDLIPDRCKGLQQRYGCSKAYPSLE